MAEDEKTDLDSPNSKRTSENENISHDITENVSNEEEFSIKISKSNEETPITIDVIENTINEVENEETKRSQILLQNEVEVFQAIKETFTVDDQQYSDDFQLSSDLPDLSLTFDNSVTSDENESPNKSELKIVSENDKENLLNLYQDLNVQKKSTISRNRALTNALSEFLQSKEPNVYQDGHTVDIVSLQKYNDALDRLYKIYHKREMVLEAERVESQILLVERKKIMDVATEHRDKLSAKLYDTGITLISSQTGLPLSEKLVSKLIARFFKTQCDLSEARLDFIIIQNFLTEMKARDSELNNLGDGLKVIDYESMLSEVQCLQVVIESKNEDLDHLRQRCFIDTHKIVHLGEKYSQLLWTFEQQKQILNTRKMEEQSLRRTVSEIKKVKDDLRAKHNTLIQQAGLLNKIPLLKDYDSVIYQVSLISN
ncbi:unnamed protein product [Diamesa serratosioi]